MYHMEGRVFHLESLCSMGSEGVALLQPCSSAVIICSLCGCAQECRTDKCLARVPGVSYGKQVQLHLESMRNQ